MDYATYDALPGVNWSTLKNLGKSPAHYKHRLSSPRADGPAMLLGRAVHKAVLEPGAFSDDFLVWQGGTRRGAAWDAFRHGAGCRDILKQDELDDVLALQTAVRSDPIAAHFLRSGAAETCAQWTDDATGIACKGLIDWYDARNGVLLDLKTGRDASPGGFGRATYNWQYHCQMAYYRDGLVAMGLRVDRVILCAVEKEAPYPVVCYEVPADVLELGRTTYRELLVQLKGLRAADLWPGYATGVVQLQLPKWAMPDVDSDDTGEAGEAW